MNRRQFLTYTIALAVAAPFARLGQAPDSALLPAPADLASWTPTQGEVDQWLEYYKVAVQVGAQRFAESVNGLFAGRPEHEGPWLITRWAATPEESLDEHERWVTAERAFHALESDRMAVAVSQGAGYSAGRDGLPRFNERYTGPSNEAFGWYNMWAIGDRDRRGIRLPRSPGVTWPDGKPPPWLHRYI